MKALMGQQTNNKQDFQRMTTRLNNSSNTEGKGQSIDYNFNITWKDAKNGISLKKMGDSIVKIVQMASGHISTIFNTNWKRAKMFVEIMFGANLVIQGQICGEWSCRQVVCYGWVDWHWQRQYPFGQIDSGVKRKLFI